jgi:hypothetical protein
MPKIVELKILLIDGVVYQRHPDNSLTQVKGKSDWGRIDAMSDEEIENIASKDEDRSSLTDQDWEESVEARRQKLTPPAARMR